jgi:hypothetical protein
VRQLRSPSPARTAFFRRSFTAAFPDGTMSVRQPVDHRQPITGDHGVRWTSNGQEFPTYAFAPDRIGVGKA